SRRRARRIDSKVVLPVFHWLVNRVTLPGASNPCHSQEGEVTASSSDSVTPTKDGREGSGSRGSRGEWFMANLRRSVLGSLRDGAYHGAPARGRSVGLPTDDNL